MKFKKLAFLSSHSIFLLLVLFIYSCSPKPVQKKEGEMNAYKIKDAETGINIKSYPYTPYAPKNGIGETFVYNKKELLYTLPEYFENPVVTTSDGEYFIEINPVVMFNHERSNVDEEGHILNRSLEFDENVVTVYKKGEKTTEVHFSDLELDTTKFNVHTYHHEIKWGFVCKDTTITQLKKIADKPYRLVGDKIYLFTIDDEAILIDIKTGKVLERMTMFDYLEGKKEIEQKSVEPDLVGVNYPPKFYLPFLTNGKSFEVALSTHLNREVAINYRDEAHVQVYFHELLVDKKGKCLEADVTVSVRNSPDEKFGHKFDEAMKANIEKWAQSQIFSTQMFPSGFPKYNYFGFVYLK